MKTCKALDFADMQDKRYQKGFEELMKFIKFLDDRGVIHGNNHISQASSRWWEYVHLKLQIPSIAVNIADIGTGGSVFPFWLAYEGYQVDVVEPIPSAAKHLSWMAEKSGLPVTVYQEDACDYLHFPPSSVEVVTSVSVLEHTRNRKDFIRSCGRITKDLLLMTVDYGAYEMLAYESIKSQQEMNEIVIQPLEDLGVSLDEPIQMKAKIPYKNNTETAFTFVALTFHRTRELPEHIKGFTPEGRRIMAEHCHWLHTPEGVALLVKQESQGCTVRFNDGSEKFFEYASIAPSWEPR